MGIQGYIRGNKPGICFFGEQFRIILAEQWWIIQKGRGRRQDIRIRVSINGLSWGGRIDRIYLGTQSGDVILEAIAVVAYLRWSGNTFEWPITF
jgi:hypothetical protein